MPSILHRARHREAARHKSLRSSRASTLCNLKTRDIGPRARGWSHRWRRRSCAGVADLAPGQSQRPGPRAWQPQCLHTACMLVSDAHDHQRNAPALARRAHRGIVLFVLVMWGSCSQTCYPLKCVHACTLAQSLVTRTSQEGSHRQDRCQQTGHTRASRRHARVDAPTAWPSRCSNPILQMHCIAVTRRRQPVCCLMARLPDDMLAQRRQHVPLAAPAGKRTVSQRAAALARARSREPVSSE